MYIKVYSTAITTSIMSLDIIHRLVYFQKTVMFLLLKTQRFGDWILSMSSGKTYSFRSNR